MTNQAMEWDEIAGLLSTAGLANLATASLDGRPHVSVVSPAVDGEFILFATKTSSGKARNLRANPNVALTWRPGAEIYLWGTAELITGLDEKRRISAAKLFGLPDRPDFVFVRVEPTSATVLAVGADGLARRTWKR